MSLTIKGVDGKQHEFNLQENGLSLYRAAIDEKLSLRQYMNKHFPTSAEGPDAFQQLCVQAGIRFKADENTGMPASSMRDIMDGPGPLAANQTGGSSITQPNVPNSRILFPAAILEAVEDALTTNRPAAVNAFESLVGFRQTIAGNRFERPYISYSGKGGPEDSQMQRIGQNMRPANMLSITASDVTQTIPTTSIGLVASEESMAETSLDLVAMSMTRFMQITDYQEWLIALLDVLQGDSDGVVTPISAATSALAQTTAQSYDPLITSAGNITQKAWLKYLYNNNMMARKTHVVTDFDSALALDTRTNLPGPDNDNSKDRIDVPFAVQYPDLGESVNLIIMPEDSNWPSHTLMGLDQAYALGKVTSSSASYSAIENVVMKKSMEYRIDRGYLVYRLFDDAFDTLSLTVS